MSNKQVCSADERGYGTTSLCRCTWFLDHRSKEKSNTNKRHNALPHVAFPRTTRSKILEARGWWTGFVNCFWEVQPMWSNVKCTYASSTRCGSWNVLEHTTTFQGDGNILSLHHGYSRSSSRVWEEWGSASLSADGWMDGYAVPYPNLVGYDCWQPCARASEWFFPGEHDRLSHWHSLAR